MNYYVTEEEYTEYFGTIHNNYNIVHDIAVTKISAYCTNFPEYDIFVDLNVKEQEAWKKAILYQINYVDNNYANFINPNGNKELSSVNIGRVSLSYDSNDNGYDFSKITMDILDNGLCSHSLDLIDDWGCGCK